MEFKDLSIPKNYNKKQIALLKKAFSDPHNLICVKVREKKVRKQINKKTIIPENSFELFDKSVKYFQNYDLKPILIKASLSVKMQLDKKVRNLITFRLPRWVGTTVVGSLYFNCVKLESDITKLSICDYDLVKDSIGSYKIKSITLDEVVELMTKDRLALLKVIAGRLDSEYKYNSTKTKNYEF
jgi:hypothetical protein